MLLRWLEPRQEDYYIHLRKSRQHQITPDVDLRAEHQAEQTLF